MLKSAAGRRLHDAVATAMPTASNLTNMCASWRGAFNLALPSAKGA